MPLMTSGFPEIDAQTLLERLFDKMDDHDLLQKVSNDMGHMATTMQAFISAANIRLSNLEDKQGKLENRMNYFCGGLAVIMFVIEVFFKK